MSRGVFGCSWVLVTLTALLGLTEQAMAEVFRPVFEGNELMQPVRDSQAARSRCGASCNGLFGGLGDLYLLMPPQVATTTAAYPTLYWYQPTAGTNRIEVNLYQYDPENEAETGQFSPVLKTQAIVSGEPGITALSLSEATDLEPLTVGETYYWEVMFFCDPASCDADKHVWGWVQRVELDAATAQQLASASLTEQVAIAADAGLWFEAVTGLVTLLREQPNDPDLHQRWTELLVSVGLEVLADEPLMF